MSKTHLISIGVDSCICDGSATLRFATNDAIGFFNSARKAEQIHLDDACMLLGDEATYSQVHAALNLVFVDRASVGDRVIFYYSGHAVLDTRLHTGYLTLASTRGRCFGINMRELRGLFEDCQATTAIGFIDACHSGAVAQEKDGLAASFFNFRLLSSDSPSLSSKQFITACASSQRVKESANYEQSFFTHHLISILENHLRANRRLTTASLYDRLCNALERDGQPAPFRFGSECGRTLITNGGGPLGPYTPVMTSHVPEWLANAVACSAVYPIASDNSTYVSESWPNDGATLSVAQTIKKTWTLRNSGQIIWRNRYLKRIGSSRGTGIIETDRMIPIPETHPGETVEIAISMTMPSYPATPVLYFKMVDAVGELCFPQKYGLSLNINVVYPDP